MVLNTYNYVKRNPLGLADNFGLKGSQMGTVGSIILPEGDNCGCE